MQTAARQTPKILIIDDHADHCLLPCSLVILDGGSPGISGFEAAARIRRIAGALPVVMLSFDANPGDAIRRVEAGLSGHAVKPVARAHLLRLICDALETREFQEPRQIGSLYREERESARPARILVVEDSPDNRLLVQAYLKDSLYRLTFAEDGKAAVDGLAAADFDLILMDVRMPVWTA